MNTASSPSPGLLQICEELTAGSNPYFGRAQIEHVLSELSVGGLDAETALKGRVTLARHYLRLGRNEEAVNELRGALEAGRREGVDAGLLRAVLPELGLAYLRWGEITNCVGFHNPSMCIYPIAPAARHPDPAASLEALRIFESYLSAGPHDSTVHWLMLIAAMTAGRYPDGVPISLRLPAKESSADSELAVFRDVASSSGLEINDNSGGAIVDDFDNDGFLDIITSSIHPCTPLRFFRNDGRGRFENVAPSSGLEEQLGGGNLVHADFDNDGFVDVFVLRGSWMGSSGRIRNSLLRNLGPDERGRVRFADVTAESGLAEPAYPTQTAAFADYDNDGDLDLYVGNEGVHPRNDCCFPSQLFRNDGPGDDGGARFTEVAQAAGVANGRFAKGVTWGDYDNDGDPDLYVSNIGPNRLYRNDGVDDNDQVRFTDVAVSLGVTEPAGRSFPTWFFDYDNDGDLDLFVAEYQGTAEQLADYHLGRSNPGMHPRLYRNDGRTASGHRGFTELSLEVGLGHPSLPMGANFGDLDNDGFLDFYLGTGDTPFQTVMPNRMYRNDRGRRFVDVTFASGFGHLQKGHGVAFADFDHDGDQDVFEQMGGAYPGDAYPSVLYENPGHGNNWLALSLVGTTSNRSAIGVRIRVDVSGASGRRSIHRRVGTGGSFGGSPLRQEIGLGDASKIERLTVYWPTSVLEHFFDDVEVNRAYELREDASELVAVERRQIRLGGAHSRDH